MRISEVDSRHMLGRVHSIDTFSAVDGPGTRSVVFLQGCMFRCLYCQNRDTWDPEAGELYSVPDLLEQILPYRPFMLGSGGGVTVSGGEPLLQREFVREFFQALHWEGLSTALDTNGFLPPTHYDAHLQAMIVHTDLVLLDLKHMDEAQHLRLTGMSNEYTLRFAHYLADFERPVWVRYVVVPGFTDQMENAYALAEFLAPMKNVERVELLPYHQLGVHKWQLMGDQNQLAGVKPPTQASLQALAEPFEALGLVVTRV